MASFLSESVSVTAATATKLVDAADFSRQVYVHEAAGNTQLAFTSAAASTGVVLGNINGTPAASFVLPAGQELWAYNASSPETVGVFVTAVA